MGFAAVGISDMQAKIVVDPERCGRKAIRPAQHKHILSSQQTAPAVFCQPCAFFIRTVQCKKAIENVGRDTASDIKRGFFVKQRACNFLQRRRKSIRRRRHIDADARARHIPVRRFPDQKPLLSECRRSFCRSYIHR